MCFRRVTWRFGAPIVDRLKTVLEQKNKILNEQVKALKAKHGEKEIGAVTVDRAYGGMRDVLGLVYEPSLLDKDEGIRFRGYSIPECQKLLPKAPEGGKEMLPEAMFWLLLTGDIPTNDEVKALTAHLHARVSPDVMRSVKRIINSLPVKMHPMTQYSIGVMGLQMDSGFAKAYSQGNANKENYWSLTLEDALDCVARSPLVAAMVYRRIATGRNDESDACIAPNPTLDWAASFTEALGYQNAEFWDCMRLYLSIHVDHEGGNVSAHTTTLVGSTLSDPYLSYSSGLNGLAGPLHGLANQEVLKFLFEMRTKCHEAGVDMRDKKALATALEKFIWELLASKRVVPGYGHAVLRKTDPRYTCQREFAARNFPTDDMFVLVDTIYSIMPDILTKHGKTKNPFPNVDAHSGVLLHHYGMLEQDFYTVLFGVSRQLGVLTGLVWDRLQRRPLERPKSVTTDWLLKKFSQ